MSTALREERIEEGKIHRLVLNRPDRMNALDGDLLDSLDRAIQSLRGDRSIRAVILAGAGSKAFCAGADMKERRNMSDDETRQRLRDYRRCFGAFEHLPVPTIAAIDGYALGGGLELALCADFRVADPSAEMGLTETKLGIIPGAGGTQRLPRVIGASEAKRMIFSGARIDGEEAYELGLADELVRGRSAEKGAAELAAEMFESAPLAVAEAKRAINRGTETDLETGLEVEFSGYENTLSSEDRREGLEAFREGREPEFEGK